MNKQINAIKNKKTIDSRKMLFFDPRRFMPHPERVPLENYSSIKAADCTESRTAAVQQANDLRPFRPLAVAAAMSSIETVPTVVS